MLDPDRAAGRAAPRVAAALAGAVLLTLAGCAGGGDRAVPAAAATRSSVVLSEFSITPNAISATASGTLTVRNGGRLSHNLDVVSADNRSLATTRLLGPGASARLPLRGIPAGTYLLICDMPGHKDQGMVATLSIA